MGLEMTKMKLTARLTEAEGTISNQNSKIAQVEKAKAKLQSELEAMLMNLDQAQVMNAAMERKAKQFDTVINEWKQKVDSLTFDLDVTQKETRNISSDLFKIKSAYEETVMQLEEVRRENKTLSNEIKDIMDQISEGGHSIHEIDKIRKRLEAEKDEEFLAVKKNQSKALEALQGALETESKGKAEALRMKKKLETDVADLELALEHANAGALETQATIKKYQGQVRDAQAKVDEESHLKSVAQDDKVNAERRTAAIQNALEEGRTLLEQADRARRALEQELADSNESLADLSNTNQAIAAAKRKMESELNTLSADLDEMSAESKLSEEKAARAMIDAARLADELRAEQDVAMTLEKDRKLLEAQCKDAHSRADEAETNALKVGRKAVIKMESRIRELESELDAETRRYADASKNFRKTERRIKELTFASDEDKKNHERMQALIDQLQGKVKSYKKQIEEAEEIAALNLAKYRQVQSNLCMSVERADLNEQALAKTRARSASLGPK